MHGRMVDSPCGCEVRWKTITSTPNLQISIMEQSSEDKMYYIGHAKFLSSQSLNNTAKLDYKKRISAPRKDEREARGT